MARPTGPWERARPRAIAIPSLCSRQGGLDLSPRCMYSVSVEFDWDSQNRKHIGRHRVTPGRSRAGAPERSPGGSVPGSCRQGTGALPGANGQGQAAGGGVVERGQAIRVVTTYPMTRRQDAYSGEADHDSGLMPISIPG